VTFGKLDASIENPFSAIDGTKDQSTEMKSLANSDKAKGFIFGVDIHSDDHAAE
jgi:hypothetical protein